MHTSFLNTQRGVALVVSLVMLVAITLIGVFVMSSSHLEWLMSSNSMFQSDAELRAEAALLDGENVAAGINANTFVWSNADAYYNNLNPPDALPANPRNIANWESGAYITLNAPTISPAEYLIEYTGCFNQSGGNSCNPCQPMGSTCVYTYRIWAYATDSKGASSVVQSTFAQKVIASIPPLPPSPVRIAFALIDHDQPPSP